MIYIFSSCRELCLLPCTLCNLGCKCCKESCSGFYDLWAPIWTNPLGGYVMVTWVFMLPAIICAGMGISGAEGNATYVAIGNIVIGIIHAGFAYYLQRQLVAGLEKRGWEPGTAKNHKDIAKEAKTIAKYDIGFCLYFFFFVAAFGFNCWGVSAASDSSMLMVAVALMITYGVWAWLYGLCWCCGQACFAGASYAREKGGKKGKRGLPEATGGPAPDTVGASA